MYMHLLVVLLIMTHQCMVKNQLKIAELSLLQNSSVKITAVITDLPTYITN